MAALCPGVRPRSRRIEAAEIRRLTRVIVWRRANESASDADIRQIERANCDQQLDIAVDLEKIRPAGEAARIEPHECDPSAVQKDFNVVHDATITRLGAALIEVADDPHLESGAGVRLETRNRALERLFLESLAIENSVLGFQGGDDSRPRIQSLGEVLALEGRVHHDEASNCKITKLR